MTIDGNKFTASGTFVYLPGLRSIRGLVTNEEGKCPGTAPLCNVTHAQEGVRQYVFTMIMVEALSR